MTIWLTTFVAVAAAVLGLSAAAALAQTKTFVTIGSGSTTGLYYPTAVGIAKIINEANIPVRANARSTGGSVFNAKAIGQGQLPLGLMQNNIAKYASTGEGVGDFQANPIKSSGSIACPHPQRGTAPAPR